MGEYKLFVSFSYRTEKYDFEKVGNFLELLQNKINSEKLSIEVVSSITHSSSGDNAKRIEKLASESKFWLHIIPEEEKDKCINNKVFSIDREFFNAYKNGAFCRMLPIGNEKNVYNYLRSLDIVLDEISEELKAYRDAMLPNDRTLTDRGIEIKNIDNLVEINKFLNYYVETLKNDLISLERDYLNSSAESYKKSLDKIKESLKAERYEDIPIYREVKNERIKIGSSTCVYTGTLLNGYPIGNGDLFDITLGIRYKLNWDFGKKFSGNGEVTSDGKLIYMGDIENLNFEGEGKYTKDDLIYEGNFKSNKFYGKGILTCENFSAKGLFDVSNCNGTLTDDNIQVTGCITLFGEYKDLRVDALEMDPHIKANSEVNTQLKHKSKGYVFNGRFSIRNSMNVSHGILNYGDLIIVIKDHSKGLIFYKDTKIYDGYLNLERDFIGDALKVLDNLPVSWISRIKGLGEIYLTEKILCELDDLGVIDSYSFMILAKLFIYLEAKTFLLNITNNRALKDDRIINLSSEGTEFELMSEDYQKLLRINPSKDSMYIYSEKQKVSLSSFLEINRESK